MFPCQQNPSGKSSRVHEGTEAWTLSDSGDRVDQPDDAFTFWEEDGANVWQQDKFSGSTYSVVLSCLDVTWDMWLSWKTFRSPSLWFPCLLVDKPPLGEIPCRENPGKQPRNWSMDVIWFWWSRSSTWWRLSVDLRKIWNHPIHQRSALQDLSQGCWHVLVQIGMCAKLNRLPDCPKTLQQTILTGVVKLTRKTIIPVRTRVLFLAETSHKLPQSEITTHRQGSEYFMSLYLFWESVMSLLSRLGSILLPGVAVVFDWSYLTGDAARKRKKKGQ